MKSKKIQKLKPVPPEELARFLELSLDPQTDEYLRRLALFAVQSADLAAISTRLGTQVERLERRDRLARVPQAEDLHGQPAAVVQRLQREVAKVLGLSVAFHHPLKDGGQGPEMRVIPRGRFLMGSPAGEPMRDKCEGPQHQVTISKPFAIGRHAVTFSDYEQFCSKTTRKSPNDKGWGRGWQPVIYVSWQDAQEYCAWLTEQTGVTYRLPSEAEWEYAARAATTTAFWWGDYIDTRLANYDGNASYAGSPIGKNRKRTLPVKQFDPNPFGLYQVHGNVWEFCQDHWHDSYQGAPVDERAWEDEGSGKRLIRGGSFSRRALYCRSAARGFASCDRKYMNLGFRVCCDLVD